MSRTSYPLPPGRVGPRTYTTEVAYGRPPEPIRTHSLRRYFLGADPGKTGALAIVNDAGELEDVIDMPAIEDSKPAYIDGAALAQWLRPYLEAGTVEAVIEYVNAMPPRGVGGARRSMGAQSSFAFGFVSGGIRPVLAALGIPTRVVTPGKWKARMDLKGKSKDASRARAAAQFPQYSHSFKRKKDDGRAEAAIIALYAWRSDKDAATAAAMPAPVRTRRRATRADSQTILQTAGLA